MFKPVDDNELYCTCGSTYRYALNAMSFLLSCVIAVYGQMQDNGSRHDHAHEFVILIT